jgi:EmrB/QacA subfamily drug resistance transporter
LTFLSRRRVTLITLGIMLSLFLASMEGTVVATAMPTIVAQLGGLSIYSWVFSVYLLTSTTTGPIYGKLSDLYGRKRVYIFSLALFLAGSLLCGQAQSMEQLILYRAVQGLGAGGILPLVFTIIGELFNLEQRARMQGLLSGVWGVSSIIGPLIGGFLVDQVAWQWVFYINLIPGLLAGGLVWFAWKDSQREPRTAAVDFAGAALLTGAVFCLLLGMEQLGASSGSGVTTAGLSIGGGNGWSLLMASAVLFAGLVWVERRAADPMLPLALFRDRLFAVSIVNGVLAGWAMFGGLNYVPLFVQAVLGTTATQAGISLTPMSLAWTVFSVVGSALLLRMGYRTLALIGMILLTAGNFLMAQIGTQTSLLQVMVNVALMGAGMGLAVPAFLIAVQSTVPRHQLGTATSTLTFSRSIGGTLGVSVMGVFLSTQLAGLLQASGIDPGSVSLDSLVDPVAASTLSPAAAALEEPLRQALAAAIANLFLIAFAAALLGTLVVLFAPGGKIARLIEERSA